MRFALAPEQRDFADSLRKMCDAAGTPGIIRAWGRGDHRGGRALIRQLAGASALGLAIDEDHGGLGAEAIDLVVAFTEIGRAAVPGPLVETAAVIPALLQGLSDPSPAKRWLNAFANGTALGTIALGADLAAASGPAAPAASSAASAGASVVTQAAASGPAAPAASSAASAGASVVTQAAASGPAAPAASSAASAGASVVTQAAASGPAAPAVLDADTAEVILVVDGERVRTAQRTAPARSVDQARRLFTVAPDDVVAEGGSVRDAAATAFDAGVLAVSAQLLGAGRALLDTSVAYVKQRHQFGKPIGQYQAIKHHLANALIGLEMAQPLLYRAALSTDAAKGGNGTPATAATRSRDVSAAKIACADAAYRTARIALQVHGAIGYTAEYDLSLWLTKVTALRSAWGTADFHRTRVAAALAEESAA